MSDDQFLGTVYTDDFDEEVRPSRHEDGMRPFTGHYVMSYRYDGHLMLATSQQQARKVLERLLESKDIELQCEETVSSIRATGITVGHARYPDRRTRVESAGFAWFPGQSDPDVQRGLQQMSHDLVREFEETAPPDEKPKRKPRKVKLPLPAFSTFQASFSLTFHSARLIWAQGEEHASSLLEEDLAVLFDDECLDRWMDDLTGKHDWEIHGVEPKPKATTA